MTKAMKLALTATALYMVGCSSGGTDGGGSSTTVTATKPSSVVSSLTSKIEEVGTGMSSAMNGAATSSIRTMSSVDTQCGVHGEPLFQPLKTNQNDCTTANGWWDGSSNECRMPNTDFGYSGMKFYCFIAKNTGSPDSLQGAFGLFGNISCALEKQGVQWDGVERQMNVTLSETDGCFDAGQLSDGPCDGDSSCSMDMTVTAEQLSGQYYDTSLRLGIGSMHYYAKVKVSDGITELAVSNNGQGEANVEDVYSVKLDEASGQFAYEGRFDRIDANCGNSCGWSRHYRVMLDLLTDSTEIIPESIEGAIAELYHDTNNNNYNATLSTIKGSMTTGSGLTGRIYAATETAVADAINATNLTDSGTSCFKLAADPENGACAGNAGIDKGNGTVAFFLAGGSFKSQTTAADKYLDGDVWFANLVGLNFTSVGLSPE